MATIHYMVHVHVPDSIEPMPTSADEIAGAVAGSYDRKHVELVQVERMHLYGDGVWDMHPTMDEGAAQPLDGS